MTHSLIKALAEQAGRFYKRSEPHILDYIATRPLERDKLYYIRNLVKQYQVMKKLMVTEGSGEEETTLTTTFFMPVLRVNRFWLVMEIL